MIRTCITAALLAATILTGCNQNSPPIVMVKTIHPDGSTTCTLKQEGAGEQRLGSCPPEAIQNWQTSTVTATPTP